MLLRTTILLFSSQIATSKNFTDRIYYSERQNYLNSGLGRSYCNGGVSVNVEHFLDFGDAASVASGYGNDCSCDSNILEADDGMQTFTYSAGINGFGSETHSDICVSSNGPVHFSFGGFGQAACPFEDWSHKPVTGKYATSWSGIAALWTDMNALLGGNVYYRYTTDSADLDQIQLRTNENTVEAHIITYYKMAHIQSGSKMECDIGVSFQYVIVPGADNPTVLLNYGEQGWYTFGASSGWNSLAQADGYGGDLGAMQDLEGYSFLCNGNGCEYNKCKTGESLVYSSAGPICQTDSGSVVEIETPFSFQTTEDCSDYADQTSQAYLDRLANFQMFLDITIPGATADQITCAVGSRKKRDTGTATYDATVVTAQATADTTDSSVTSSAADAASAAVSAAVAVALRNADPADLLLDSSDTISEPTVGTSTVASIECADGQLANDDNTACVDDDECETNPCDSAASCVNIDCSVTDCTGIDGFTCTCDSGYTGDGLTCTDDDECDVLATADCTQVCTNTPGSFTCSCNDGYNLQSDGTSCTAGQVKSFAANQVSSFVSDMLEEIYGFTAQTRRRKRDTDLGVVDNLKTHGCWCTGTEPNYEPLMGTPVSEVDRVCKIYMHCHSCTGCTHGDVSTFNVIYADSSNTYACDDTLTGCDASVCECQLAFATSAAAAIFAADGVVDPVPATSCNRQALGSGSSSCT